MAPDLPKTYDAKRAEALWTERWEKDGVFAAGQRPEAEPFTVMLPPPNVTSVLHMGHALNAVVQDVIVRWRRMQGRDVLWLPGTDHAGIATQAVVERRLWEERRVRRKDLGREAFQKEVWAWKEQYGAAILRQLRELGSSCDWSRTAFTMDENPSRAVRVAFVHLWEKGLVYRGARLVNWDCVLQSAVGDDELDETEVDGHLWHFRYPFADGKGHITIATTRPETMLGDTAVAVNPSDERYRVHVGRFLDLPLVHRKIPLIADETVDPAFGTGAVKVTPGHDFADYERGQRHKLPIVNILNPDGTINGNGGPYAGLDRAVARKKVVEDLDRKGLLERTERHRFTLPLSDRSKSPIEPLVSEQWFVKMKPLAEPAIRAVQEKRLRFVPERWTKVYLDWLTNVRDWCISRQLWWGHQIPVWYDADGTPAASVEELRIGAPHPATGKPIVRRDEDVLDTWASSWLWPFSTLGWPERTPDLSRHYPGDLLCTAREIIYLWVARMVMAGYEFLGEPPFHTVYINATVLDAIGRRMSKSLGNGIDPRDMIKQYGADAVRFTLCELATEGQDLKLAETKFELGRNFMNKVWNAARFVLTSVSASGKASAGDPGGAPGARGGELEDRWIRSRRNAAVEAVTQALEGYRYHDAATALYHFVWGDFCDWYVEWSKPRLKANDAACAATLLDVLGTIVRLLQPFAPYLAEELRTALGHEEYAALLPWPGAGARDPEAERQIAEIQGVVTGFRTIRADNRIPPGAFLEAGFLDTPDPAFFERYKALVAALAGIGELKAGSAPQPCGTKVLAPHTMSIPLSADLIEAEKTRIRGELEKAQKLLESIERKLADERFTTRAKPEVVERERQRKVAAEEQVNALKRALEDLG
ncbi:MAG TPA: valine--tRNA ligase [Planctomycetota bacterium]|nr:valine--tRNA ligase [Planctomycetota bacterium]